MELFKDITKNPKEVAQELYTYISTFETQVIEGNAEQGIWESVQNLDQNCVLNLCIAIINMQIECCSGLYDELLSVEYGHFDEPDVPRFNWLCKIRNYLENNFEELI